ncbi:CDP-glycerol glycerophosphotransferase family protein [Coprococcus catus]|uniref:CDP-glycerol glycerophosphotransferase family protein n=1 Tax=Coprococcus catus TaxID=116085 RepID=UPI001D07CB28|nr:CDP-glycerol glycerophosphotransferase family protein [Coprococcus catus]MCB6493992.1 CDP-glycerol glycerophosphotransferase family protein [Coprococcus catus]
MKKLLKKIYDVLPNGIKKLYWQTRKKVGQILMFRIVFPLGYKHYIKGKKIKRKKAVFVEVRFDEITDSFRLVYDRMKADGFDVHEQFIENIKPGKWGYIKRCLRMLEDISDAHYVFLNDACNVTSCIPLRKGTKIYQLWHACGAFKKFGMSTAELIFGDNRKSLEKYPNYGNLSYVTVSSPEVIWAYEEAMNLKDTKTQVVATGVSRTDVFYDQHFIEQSKAAVYSVCPAAENKKIILYAPTFRGRVAKAESPDCLDIPAMKRALRDEYVLLIKHHPFVKQPPVVPEDCADFAMDVTKSLEIDQLLCASDVCVSDYSSLIFEYSLFERPMIFFAYDLDDYFDWRGFYYNYDELTPGPVVQETEEIIDYIRHLDARFDQAQVHAFKEKFMSSCDGHATDRIMALVLNSANRSRRNK